MSDAISKVWTEVEPAQDVVEETVVQDVWSAVSEQAEIIVAYPNKWGDPERLVVQEAVVKAGWMSAERTKPWLGIAP